MSRFRILITLVVDVEVDTTDTITVEADVAPPPSTPATLRSPCVPTLRGPFGLPSTEEAGDG